MIPSRDPARHQQLFALARRRCSNQLPILCSLPLAADGFQFLSGKPFNQSMPRSATGPITFNVVYGGAFVEVVAVRVLLLGPTNRSMKVTIHGASPWHSADLRMHPGLPG